jgi:hypothetical protein
MAEWEKWEEWEARSHRKAGKRWRLAGWTALQWAVAGGRSQRARWVAKGELQASDFRFQRGLRGLGGLYWQF